MDRTVNASQRIRILLAGLLLFGMSTSVVFAQPSDLPAPQTIRLSDPLSLQFYLRWTPDREPLISAHRGGPIPGYPENCLASFENSLRYGRCLIELDVRKTLDGVMILMHDKSLDRTTTDSGLVSEVTMDRILKARLIDNEGDTTEYGIPTFQQALEWAKGKAILTVDVKRGVEPRDIVRAIHEHRAEAYAVVITYNADQAKAFHDLDPNLMLSVGISRFADYERLIEYGVPPNNMIAFVGVSAPDKELLDFLHKRGVRAIVGTMGNIDNSALKRGKRVYRDLYKLGADVLSTDNVPLVSSAIGEMQLKRKRKNK